MELVCLASCILVIEVGWYSLFHENKLFSVILRTLTWFYFISIVPYSNIYGLKLVMASRFLYINAFYLLGNIYLPPFPTGNFSLFYSFVKLNI